MLYGEIIAFCSQINTKHINTLCGQNVELLNVKLAVHIVTMGFNGLNLSYRNQPVNAVLFIFSYSLPIISKGNTKAETTTATLTVSLYLPTNQPTNQPTVSN